MQQQSFFASKRRGKRYEAYTKETTSRVATPAVGEFERELQRSPTLQKIVSREETMHVAYVQSAPQTLDLSTKRVFQRLTAHTPAEFVNYSISSPHVTIGSEKSVRNDSCGTTFFPPYRLSDELDFDFPNLPLKSSSLLLNAEKALPEQSNRKIEKNISLISDDKSINQILVDTETLFQLLHSFLRDEPQLEAFSLPLRCTDDRRVHIGHCIRHSTLHKEAYIRLAFEKLLRKKRASNVSDINAEMRLGEFIIQADRTSSREYILVKLELVSAGRDNSADNPINFTFSPLSHKELCIMRLASEWYPVVQCVRIDIRTLSVIAIQTFRSSEGHQNSFQCVFGMDPIPDANERRYLYTRVYHLFAAMGRWTSEMGPGQYMLDFNQEDFTLYKEISLGSVNQAALTLNGLLARKPAQSIIPPLINVSGTTSDRPWWSWGPSPLVGGRRNRKRPSKGDTPKMNCETASLSTIVFLKRKGNNLDVLGLQK